MLPTFKPPIGPSPGTSHDRKINLWEAEFGDGYSQPTPKGLNHIRRTLDLKWDALSYEQMEEIITFFTRMAGNQPFYYKPFGVPSAIKWTCKRFKETTNDGIWSVSAELEQSFTNQT